MKEIALRFRDKIERIMAWALFPVSNSVSKGINKNIQDIRREGCGYRNLHNYFDMILLRQSCLKFRF